MVLKFTKMDNLLETLERSAACSVEFFIRILLSVFHTQDYAFPRIIRRIATIRVE